MKTKITKKPLLKIIIYLYLILASAVSFAETKPVIVSVKQMPEESWLVEYQLPKSVNQVSFYREGDFSRTDWKLFNNNLILDNDNPTRSSIKSVDGTLFKSFKLQFNSNFEHLKNDYELNLAFSDGGLALYTGHLVLSIKDETVEHYFKFMPRKGNHSIIKGNVSSVEQSWLDTNLQGSYVYFGQTQPLNTEHMVAVLDQQLPEWIQQEMMVALPKIYAYYTEQFKLALNEKPMILFSYKTTEESGTQYSGGALPGVIQLTLKGKDWHKKSKENMAGFLLFIAHEAAHLWNAQMVQLSGMTSESWIHEGNAEAVSLKALLYLGIYNESDVLAANENHLNKCIDDLKTHAVSQYDKHKNFWAYYSCGAIVGILTEKAIQTKNINTDLFDFWAELIKRVNSNNLQITPEQYLKSLLQLSNDNKTLANIITLIEEPQDRPIEFFSEIFQSAGMPLKADYKHPKKAQQAIQTTIKHLLMMDCQTYSYENHIDYYTVGKMKTCQFLKPGMKISEIAGLPVKNKGFEIYNIVQESCQNNDLIQIKTLLKSELGIPCNKKMPVLTPWLTFEI